MQKGKEFAERAPKHWVFERVEHKDGDFSWEVNYHGCLWGIHEMNFDKRADAKRLKDFLEHHSPEYMLKLYRAYTEMRDTLEVLSHHSNEGVAQVAKATLEEVDEGSS